MKPESFKFGDAVQVTWVDSAARRGWSNPTTEGPYEPQRVVSVGFVVACTEETLTLSSSIDNEQNVITPLILPWVAVTAAAPLQENLPPDIR